MTVIEIGILRRRRTEPDQAAVLQRWFEDRVLAGFTDRIVPLDLAAARRVAPLHVPYQAPQHDALIAGSALARSMIVVTRNTSDFARTSVDVIDPWSAE